MLLAGEICKIVFMDVILAGEMLKKCKNQFLTFPRWEGALFTFVFENVLLAGV